MSENGPMVAVCCSLGSSAATSIVVAGRGFRDVDTLRCRIGDTEASAYRDAAYADSTRIRCESAQTALALGNVGAAGYDHFGSTLSVAYALVAVDGSSCVEASSTMRHGCVAAASGFGIVGTFGCVNKLTFCSLTRARRPDGPSIHAKGRPDAPAWPGQPHRPARWPPGPAR